MAKLTLNDITGGVGSAALHNSNYALIEAAIENTLSRDGTTPNMMDADIDMNSYSLNNVQDLRTQRLFIKGNEYSGVLQVPDLDMIQDVTITSPADDDFLRYDSGTGQWTNQVLTLVDITSGMITQHQAALSITESQVSDLKSYLLDTTDTFTGTLSVTGAVSATGSIDAGTSMSADSMRIGTDTGGDSILEFYDDTNNAWRSIFWDDSEGAFFFEDNAGAFQQFGTGSGGGPDFLLGGM